ncbi:MAG: hypothetical protein ACRD9Q_09835 [Nitrososphaeraceae archaeon]
MSIHTIHGYTFNVSRSGFHIDNDAEQAEWNLVDLMKNYTLNEIAALYIALLDLDGEYPQLANDLCYLAVYPITVNWHKIDAASLSLSAH